MKYQITNKRTGQTREVSQDTWNAMTNRGHSLNWTIDAKIPDEPVNIRAAMETARKAKKERDEPAQDDEE